MTSYVHTSVHTYSYFILRLMIHSVRLTSFLSHMWYITTPEIPDPELVTISVLLEIELALCVYTGHVWRHKNFPHSGSSTQTQALCRSHSTVKFNSQYNTMLTLWSDYVEELLYWGRPANSSRYLSGCSIQSAADNFTWKFKIVFFLYTINFEPGQKLDSAPPPLCEDNCKCNPF